MQSPVLLQKKKLEKSHDGNKTFIFSSAASIHIPILQTYFFFILNRIVFILIERQAGLAQSLFSFTMVKCL